MEIKCKHYIEINQNKLFPSVKILTKNESLHSVKTNGISQLGFFDVLLLCKIFNI